MFIASPDTLLANIKADLTPLQQSFNPTHRFAAELLEKKLLSKLEPNDSKGLSRLRQNAKDILFSIHTDNEERSLPTLWHAAGFVANLFTKYLPPDEPNDKCWVPEYWEDLEKDFQEGCRTGPGTVEGEVENTSCFYKLAFSRPSCSSEDLLKYFCYTTIHAAPGIYLDFRKSCKLFGEAEIRAYSRFTSVRKNNETDRPIRIYPTIDTYMQQGMKHVLELKLERLGVYIKGKKHSPQYAHNQRLARQGSVDGTLSTIDGKSFSDYILKLLVLKLFPVCVHEILSLLAPSAILFDEEVVDGRCAFGMGNAVTFPLQTLICLALVYEVYARNGVRFEINKNVAVFGDDVVILTQYAEEFMDLMVACRLVPNRDKSFYNTVGPLFRESCGSDWLNGINVRPVYIKKLNTHMDLFKCFNLLSAYYYRWGLDWSSSMVRTYIISVLKGLASLRYIPFAGPIDSGLREPPAEPLRCKDTQSFVGVGIRTVYDELYVPAYARYELTRTVVRYAAAGYVGRAREGKIPVLACRPTGKPKYVTAVIRGVPGASWDTPDVAERWLYDTQRMTSGLVLN